jgi:hypothetical protein
MILRLLAALLSLFLPHEVSVINPGEKLSYADSLHSFASSGRTRSRMRALAAGRVLSRFSGAFCPKTRAMTSRHFAVVEVEHSTEPLAPAYQIIMRSYSRAPVDQFVAKSLMISFQVVRCTYSATGRRNDACPMKIIRSRYICLTIAGSAS